MEQIMQTTYRQKLIEILSGDLDFHDQATYASHNFHSFPAKFPPQLPSVFINELTNPGDVVLDPMNGSGTSSLESFLNERVGIGFDIDPLALKIASVKISELDVAVLDQVGQEVVISARKKINNQPDYLRTLLDAKFTEKTREFIDYWFTRNVQLEIISLLSEINKISDAKLKNFFELALSAIIITKSGGVSLALDLAHTRPHKPKIVIDIDGQVIEGEEFSSDKSNRMKALTKRLKSPIAEFEKRYKKNIVGLIATSPTNYPSLISFGNSQLLPLAGNCVDLIVTSPPYASNAIDYMRAHKFSLVWFDREIDDLKEIRNTYVGGESTKDFHFEELPSFTQSIVDQVSSLDKKKGIVLRRYYSEMTRVLKEMYRVLKPGKSAIVVVGTSQMRGRDTETQNCLADIGQSIGFDVPKIGVRVLDRDRRMLPAGFEVNLNSQIQQRMHEEYVIGYIK
jgi:DNA modification methylase